MKMRNDDLKKITEIKQYLLDPPASFKLYDYAIKYVEEAVNVLAAYPDAANAGSSLQNLLAQLKAKAIQQEGLRGKLKEAGVMLSGLTNK